MNICPHCKQPMPQRPTSSDMDIREAIKAADGQATVAKACVAHGYDNVTRFTVQYWFTNNRLPSSEWTGETNYAVVICKLAKVFGHDVSPPSNYALVLANTWRSKIRRQHEVLRLWW